MSRLPKNIQQFLDLHLERFRKDRFTLDLFSFANSLGLNTFSTDFDDDKTAGSIEFDGDNWNIYIKKFDSNNRRRFTLAHEIGHYLSWKFQSLSYTDLQTGYHSDSVVMYRGQETSPAEAEANEIAGTLLMPEELVRELFILDKTIEEMADTFGVSIPAMTVRLQRLDYKFIESI
jgi:Zn-dependent peptidase ImmA (M78 family)